MIRISLKPIFFSHDNYGLSYCPFISDNTKSIVKRKSKCQTNPQKFTLIPSIVRPCVKCHNGKLCNEVTDEIKENLTQWIIYYLTL